jgi:formylmethanofuran dehydrogenase subunit B
MTGYGFANVDAILSLTRELNKFGKWVAMPMRGHYNVNGANIVATYLTGFPYGIDFSSGKAYYNPGETTTSDLIMNNECDLLMSVASDPIGTLPQEVCSKCLDLKLIAMDPFQTTTTEIADVVLPVAISGIESPGTAYRMDGVPLPLKSVLKSPNNLKSDKEILNMILKELKRIQGS